MSNNLCTLKIPNTIDLVFGIKSLENGILEIKNLSINLY